MIPKSLFEQFKRVSNFYFLIVAAIAFIPGVSPTTPISNVLPLLVVVGFGFARDIYEDLMRASTDRKNNNSPQVILARDDNDDGDVGSSRRGICFGKRNNSAKYVSGSSIQPGTTNKWARALIKHNLPLEQHRVVRSRDIAVGDIVLVAKGEIFPADMVLLMSSGEGGVAYVSTANLDGESNLKRHIVASPTADIHDVQELCSLRGVVRAQVPDLALHKFEGSMAVRAAPAAIHQATIPAPLDSANLLLRGSILRNTDYIYGLVVYSGFETKVALNMRNPPSKMGQTEKKLNWVVLALFVNLLVLVVAAAVVSGVVQGKFGPDQWYMGSLRNRGSGETITRGLATFLILFATYIPVSLFVTLEFVRVAQAVFMQVDAKMKSKGKRVAVRATNLNEVLGQVHFVLSDKTGTLTENIMRYIACSAGGKLYDTSKRKNVMQQAVKDNVTPVKDLVLAMALCHSVVPEPPEEVAIDAITSDKNMDGFLETDSSSNGSGVKRNKFKSSLNRPPAGELTNSAMNAGDPAKPNYQGQSPDEVALVTSARDYGVTLLERTLDSMVVDRYGTVETYTALAELEFNSDRKRMSMIFRCPDNSIRMFTKGADTIMMPLLKPSPENFTVQEHIDVFAKEGLRTLVYATKVLPEQEFKEWFSEFHDARNLLTNREKVVSEVSARLEQHMDYLAVTAVEDKLQDQVPETIKFLREAGVGLWVLTGDKRETAENIGYSANLLDAQMNVVHIKASSPDELHAQIADLKKRYIDHGDAHPRTSERQSASASERSALVGSGEAQGLQANGGALSPSGSRTGQLTRQESGELVYPQQTSLHRRKSSVISDGLRSMSSAFSSRRRADVDADLAIVIDGASLAHAIESSAEFMDVADHCKTVICCRVTPLQKALVVRMVREMRQLTTLAIGDGGNDVSMIQEAHVGVGLFGKEGTQAARAGDYAMSEFRHLQRLLAVHGRYAYIRTAGMINLSFYKNIYFTLTQVFFQIFDFVSGTTFQNQWVVSSFNVFVTAANPFLYGVFERDLEETTLSRFPSTYAENRDATLFSLRSVAEYTIIYGLWHAVCAFFGVLYFMGYMAIPFRDGKDGGFDFVGLASATIIVLVSLLKFALHSHVLNWIIILFFVLSLAAYFAVIPLFIVLPFSLEYPLEGVLGMLFSSPLFYLTAVVLVAASFVVDFLVIMGRQILRPTLVDTLQRWEQREHSSTSRVISRSSTEQSQYL